MIAGYLMALASLVGIALLALTPRIRRVAVENRRSAPRVPIVGAGAG